ncbi:MAG: [protein-PII] uridylyltransferase, partial [Nitrospinota bacterium]|nr:[protein-PII] uridylyltransferase [Nitrospinota bacterium]
MPGQIGLVLKEELDKGRRAIRAEHDAGLGGMETARRLCQGVDQVILKLCEAQSEGFTGAVVALGGYGRGALNPHSDVDLLFLIQEPAHKKENHPPNTMLGTLWDLGLKVGHSTRTVREAMSIGKDDNISRTAMMDSRYLAGSRELYDQFYNRYRWDIVRRKAGAFVQDKITELNVRRHSFGGVIRLTEPNVKNSPGGLRDLQAAMWMIRAREKVETLEDLASLGLIEQEEVEVINNAYSFMMRLRNSLHFISGGPFDKLASELQPRIAAGEGFTGSENERSAELMRKYYQAGQVIRDFTDELISLAAGYGGFGKALGFKSPKSDKLGLFADGGRLRGKSFPPSELDEKPDILLHLLNRVATEDLYPSRKVFRGLIKARDSAPPGWFQGPAAGELLMNILRHDKSERALRVILRAGILEQMIPEFAAITDLSQFDRYHRYSVDEHILHTIKNVDAIPDGGLVCQELSSLHRRCEDLPVIKLALLLHDLGKRAEDHHAEEEADFVGLILKRLGLERLHDDVYFLVNEHLAMSRTAQRLNIHDPVTIRHFCQIVKSRDNLKKLYILTHGDIAGVGPDIWTEWKDKLLLDLYDIASQYMLEGDAVFISGPEQVEALAAKTALNNEAVSEEEVRFFLSHAPIRYLHTATPEIIAEHMALERRAGGDRLALAFSTNPGDKTGEFTVAFPERIGALSSLSGVFAAKDLNIVEMIVHTFSNGLALDTVVARGAIGAFSDPTVAANFELELNEVMDGKRSVGEMLKRRARYLNREGKPRQTIEPRISVLNHLSESDTVIEVWAQDRIGLLYDITTALASMIINIESAKVVTRGALAVNIFYVTHAAG